MRSPDQWLASKPVEFPSTRVKPLARRKRTLKTFELLKDLTGRPYSAPAVARQEFCYRSLQRIYTEYTTRRKLWASPAAGSIPNW